MIPKAQYSNYLMSSTLLWLDNYILTKCQSFSNTNVRFFPIVSPFLGYQAFASPFGQFIADDSINGALVPSGVYINNTSYTTGQGGLVNIDFVNGRVYTTGLSNPTISGQFGIKYFNVKLTDEPEEKILVETAYSLRPKTTVSATGLNINQTNYPIVFIKSDGGMNKPLAFGGMDNTIDNIRLFILTDSEFSLDAINSTIKDASKTYIPILNSGHMPFNIMGGLRTGNYNYNLLTYPLKAVGQMAFINEVYVTKYNQSTTSNRNLNQQIYWSIIDMEVESYRYPRL